MPSLSAQQRQSIQECVRGVLQASLDGSTQVHAHSAENDNGSMTALASAARAAADEGVASFLEAHNEKHSNPVARLPLELVQKCFRLLDFRGRVAVSHVSRAWRRVALADCGLWNGLTLSTARPGIVLIDLLETLLARAGGMPFEFAWVSPTNHIPDALLTLVLENMGRMGSLILYNFQSNANVRLLEHKAPWMKCLISTDRGIAVLPADWGAHWVPRLETLHLNSFTIPEGFEPLSELRSFHGVLAPESSTPVLSRVFPRMVKLELQGITQESLLLLGAPPTTCRSVRLMSAHVGPLDYSCFLRACYDRQISFIAATGAGSIYPTIREFTHVSRGPCRMIIYHENFICLESAEEGITRELLGHGQLPILDECGFFSELHELAELSLPMSHFLSLRGLPAERAPALHSVCSLTIGLEMRLAPPRSPVDDIGSMSPLQMPRLEDLTLDARALEFTDNASLLDPDRTHMSWIANGLPGVLPALLCTERTQLGKLEVMVHDERNARLFTSRLDLTALRGLARVLRVWDPTSRWVKEFVGAAEQ